MEQVRYMISDAANMVQLEQHVLRYWEEELQLDVPRNEMGHRYYTDENIKDDIAVLLFLKIIVYQLFVIHFIPKSQKRIIGEVIVLKPVIRNKARNLRK